MLVERQTVPSVKIATYLPFERLTNSEVESWKIPRGTNNGSSDYLTAEDIAKKTGIQLRRIARNKTTLSMGIMAARLVVTSSGKVDFIFFSTSYPTGQNNAQTVADKLGLKPRECLDIHAACSGFTYILSLIKSDEAYFDGKRILIVASEKYSPHLTDLKQGQRDPSLSQLIFSDGSAAMSFIYGSDLQILQHKELFFPDDCIQMPINYDAICPPSQKIEVPPSPSGCFWMDGSRVFSQVVEKIPPLIMRVLEESGIPADQVAAVIPHQGSAKMLNAIARRLPDIGEKLVRDLEEGNFSSASIPKALMRSINEGCIKKSDNVIFAGFGAGLFASVAAVKI